MTTDALFPTVSVGLVTGDDVIPRYGAQFEYILQRNTLIGYQFVS